MLLDALLHTLEGNLRASCDAALASAHTQLEEALRIIAQERAKKLTEVNKERAEGLAEVAKEKTDLHREIAAMQKQQGAQEGRVVLDIGGYRYTMSVQTLRRLPGTFFDAYFSGRYTMDRNDDGSIFIDRDGKHFGQVLEYLRDGVVSVVERDLSELDMGELRWLKREFGFYCIELIGEPEEVTFVVGGSEDYTTNLASMERYDMASGKWREVTSMFTPRNSPAVCELSDGDLYIIGGQDAQHQKIATVERYNPSLDAWSSAPAMLRPRWAHCACAVDDAVYVFGGIEIDNDDPCTVSSVLKFVSGARTWNEVTPMPEERDNAGACALGSDIYIFGGNDDYETERATTYRFDTQTGEWMILAPMPQAKAGHSVCVLNSLIYVVGGSDSHSKGLTSAHCFDPAANSWRTLASMSVAINELGVFVLNESIYAVGGYHGDRSPCSLTSMERYYVVSDSWSNFSDGELGQARKAFGVHVMRLEVELLDSLMVKAERKRLHL
jgi:hypothetical protein